MIRLRPAAPSEAAALGALFTASRALLGFLPQLHSPEEDMAFIAGHILPHYAVTVAERGGAIAGYLAEHPGWIEQLYVHPDHLRQGVASTLLGAVMARQDQLELWCFAQNLAGRALYERHGFVAVDHTDGAGNAEQLPDIRYRWRRG